MMALAIAPLWTIYAVGVRFNAETARSGMDLATPPVVGHWGWDVHTGVHLVMIVALAVAGAWSLAGRGALNRRRVLSGSLGVVAESFGYAALLGAAVVLILDEAQLVAIGLSTTAPGQPSLTEAMVLSAGAGLYEEFFFRLLLIAPLALGLERLLAMPKPIAYGLGIVAGSLLFAAAHHVIFGTEAFDAYVFSYRSVAGMLFGALLLLRGFAVCAWTHAGYDFLVLMSLPAGW
jgi:hypothetical protein